MADFDTPAFHAALDAARQERGLTWSALARELNASFAHRTDIPPIAPSTLSGMAKRGGLNGNIVMTALRWLGRSPESFTPGAPETNTPIPDKGPGHLLRWNGPQLHAALDADRKRRGLTWAALAKEVGVTPSQLTTLAKSYAAGFPVVMRLTTWLGRAAAEFVVDMPV